jgi:hypothetical protein
MEAIVNVAEGIEVTVNAEAPVRVGEGSGRAVVVGAIKVDEVETSVRLTLGVEIGGRD